MAGLKSIIHKDDYPQELLGRWILILPLNIDYYSYDY